MEFLIRGGRGISYHEFALSIMDPEKLMFIAASMATSEKIPPVSCLANVGQVPLSENPSQSRTENSSGVYEELLSFAIIKD